MSNQAADAQRRQPPMLTLELAGNASGSRRDGGTKLGTVRKLDTKEGARLVVSLPRVVDAEHANLMAALLFEEIDHLPPDAVVERFKVSGIRFTEDGLNGVKAFISTYANSIRHISLKGILGPDDDEAMITQFATVFAQTELVSLNLSDNLLVAPIWRSWQNQKNLQQLVLDHVDMDDESVVQLAASGIHTALEDLYVVLTRAVSIRAVEAVNEMLQGCKNLLAFRWVNKDMRYFQDTTLPWYGLPSVKGSTLAHIVLEGAEITEAEVGYLGSVLVNLPKLLTLKLRHVGLKDSSVKQIVHTLQRWCPNLQCLDLSNNYISTEGAKMVASMSYVNLRLLALERNQIELDGVKTIMQAFGAHSSGDIEIRLDGNPFEYSKLALQLAISKGKADQECETLRRELDRIRNDGSEAQANLRRFLANQTSIISDMQLLQQEVKRLKSERDALVKALNIVGGGQGIAAAGAARAAGGDMSESEEGGGGGFGSGSDGASLEEQDRFQERIVNMAQTNGLVIERAAPPPQRRQSAGGSRHHGFDVSDHSAVTPVRSHSERSPARSNDSHGLEYGRSARRLSNAEISYYQQQQHGHDSFGEGSVVDDVITSRQDYRRAQSMRNCTDLRSVLAAQNRIHGGSGGNLSTATPSTMSVMTPVTVGTTATPTTPASLPSVMEMNHNSLSHGASDGWVFETSRKTRSLGKLKSENSNSSFKRAAAGAAGLKSDRNDDSMYGSQPEYSFPEEN